MKAKVSSFVSGLELKNGVYIILTGSEDKMSDFIRKYNYISDSKYNHIALLSVIDDDFKVYDVHPKKMRLNEGISQQTLDFFAEFSKENVSYIGVWNIPWLKPKQLEKLVDLNERITYDYQFENDSNAKLYCSEFVAKTIDKSLTTPFEWIVLKKNTEEPERFFLKKDSIEYYPVDFFINNKSIVFVDQWKN